MSKAFRKVLLADDQDAAFAEYKQQRTARKEHPYVADLIRILAPHPLGLQRGIVIAQMQALREPTKLNRPRAFSDAVQSAFNRHCAQSDTFVLGREDAVFRWPKGKGAGVWAVDRERASAWLKARDLPEV